MVQDRVKYSVPVSPYLRPISAGARELVVYRFNGRYGDRTTAKGGPRCSLALTVTNYNSQQQTIAREVPCEPLEAFAAAHDALR